MRPWVTVIIPVFNDTIRLNTALSALGCQSLPRGAFEVVVVDNGSTDGCAEVVGNHHRVRYLQERNHPGSPYSARNRGIEVARGDVVAFLDGTCVPDPTWLESAHDAFAGNDMDMLAGQVRFEVEEDDDLGSIYDGLFNVDGQFSVAKGWAPTANLFVRRWIFERHGAFNEGVRSGEDYRYTRALVAAGMRLRYVPSVLVYKRPRTLVQLIEKQRRVARGQVYVWRREGRVYSYFAKALYRGIVPPNPLALWRRIRDRGSPWMRGYFVRLYLLRYRMGALMLMESVRELVRTAKGKSRQTVAEQAVPNSGKRKGTGS